MNSPRRSGECHDRVIGAVAKVPREVADALRPYPPSSSANAVSAVAEMRAMVRSPALSRGGSPPARRPC
jgi:hypothetical protein